MSTITDENTFFNFVSFSAWHGQYAASQGTQDQASSFSSTSQNYNPVVQIVDYNSNFTGKLTHGFNTYYKLQGFNTTTGKYEVWFSMGKPLLTPPSGHTLSNISVVLTWIDR